MIDDLVMRLRACVDYYDDEKMNDILRQAVDEIERLLAENKRLTGELLRRTQPEVLVSTTSTNSAVELLWDDPSAIWNRRAKETEG